MNAFLNTTVVFSTVVVGVYVSYVCMYMSVLMCLCILQCKKYDPEDSKPPSLIKCKVLKYTDVLLNTKYSCISDGKYRSLECVEWIWCYKSRAPHVRFFFQWVSRQEGNLAHCDFICFWKWGGNVSTAQSSWAYKQTNKKNCSISSPCSKLTVRLINCKFLQWPKKSTFG